VTNYFDRFDGAPSAATPLAPGGLDLTKPLSVDQLNAARAPAPDAAPAANYFDRFDEGPHISATKEGLWDRVKDVASDAIHHSPADLLARWTSGFLPATEDYQPGGDNSQAAQQQRAQQRIAQGEREYRDEYAGRTADDPWQRPDGTRLGNAARFAADAAGMLGGGFISDPTNLIAPGTTLLGKMAGQAAVGSGVDLALQAAERAQNVRDHIDPAETALAAATGAGTVGLLEGVPALLRGRRAPAPGEPLTDGALDPTQGPGGPPALPPPTQPAALLPQPWDPRRALPDFSSDGSVIAGENGQPRLPPPASINPEAIPMASPQAFRARVQPLPIGNNPIILNDGSPRLPAPPALLEDLRGEIAPPANSNRPAPTGTPNGAVTPDVLTGQPSPEYAGLLDRLKALLANVPTTSDRAGLLSSAAAPTRPPNADMHRITMLAESGGNEAAVSPKGARGSMQVLDGTNLDPGFGVRAAADASPAERARVGRDYFDAMMRRYGDDPAKAWGAYNWGPGHMDAAIAAHGENWLEHAPAETQAYVRENMASLGKAAPPPMPARARPPVLEDARPLDDAPPAPDPLAQMPHRFDDEPQAAGVGSSAERPTPETGGNAEPAQPSIASRQPQPPAIRERAGPVDALTWLADRGGLRDDQGHDLRGTMSLQRPIPGAGSLIRKTGMGIDDAGELLHEGGWFPNHAERPTTAEVLDFLHRASTEKQYRPEDMPDVQARQQRDFGDPHVERYRPELEPIAAEHGHTLTDDEIGSMGQLIAEGRSPRDAFLTHHEREAADAFADTSREQAHPVYDGPDHTNEPGYERAQEDAYRAGPEGTGEPERGGGDESASPPVSPRAGEGGSGGAPEQLDAFGERPGDQRAALERAGDGRQRSDVAQKPPGSDGGLFDTGGKQDDLLLRGKQEGTSPASALDAPANRSLRDELGKIAASTINSHPRRLAAKLAEIVGDARVHYGRFLGDDVRGKATSDGAGKVTAHVASERDPEAVLHEAIHVATLQRYGELKAGAAPEVDAIERLRQRATKAFGRRGDDPSGQIAHALSSTDEFLAGGMTSPHVQRFLQRHNAAGLWGRFVDGVRGILGLEPRYGSLLDRTLKHGADLLDRMGDAAPRAPEGGTTLFSRGGGPVDPEHPGPAGWEKIGGMVFEPDFLSKDGSSIVNAIRSTFGDPKAALSKAGARLREFGEATAYSADGALRSMAGRFNAPTIAKLADIFHAEAGKAGSIARTYHEAVSLRTAQFGNDAHRALKPFLDDDAAMGRIRDLLATPNQSIRATASERAAAGKVRDLLKEVLEYRRDAGESIGEVGDGYFPRRLRADKVASNPEAFKRQAEKLYASIGADDPAAAADAWLLRTMDAHAGISDGLQFAGSAGSSSAKSREFGKQADVLLRDFYETNPLRAISDYISGSVKRAEQARRFGPVGREGSAERTAWVKQHGDRTQWDVMKDAIKGELRATGQDATGLMEKLDGIRATNLGQMRPGSLKAGATISVIHAWNQLGTLANATFASLPEMAMGFVRGGPRYGFTHLSTTFSEFARNVRRLPPSDAKRYAEAAGAVSSESAVDLLRARADDPTASTGVQKLLHAFYRKNGLEQWTDAGRTAAVRTGQRFVDTLAHDMESTDARTRNRAVGYLRELGVADPHGFSQNVRQGAPTIDDMRADKGFAGQYATALLRFANQSVLMPTRATKPTWANHPLGSLLFALQSYNFAFKKNVLDRVGREAVAGLKERDPARLAPAAGLVVLAGTTALVQGLRHAIDGPPAGSDTETPTHYALETMDRTGLFGAASPIINAFEGLKYRRSVSDSLQGAVIGRAADTVDALGGLVIGNNPDTNSAERKAAGAVYDTMVKPAVDAIGAGVLRGPLGSAVILGSGKREGSILPSDREAFVSGVAGPKPDEDE
jgi:hypothetical protein